LIFKELVTGNQRFLPVLPEISPSDKFVMVFPFDLRDLEKQCQVGYG
jgi:hypothetical protein